jgi:hypothetical protein
MLRATWLVLAAVMALLSFVAPALSQPPSSDVVEVRLSPVADLGADGVVTGRVRVSCPDGAQVLEALVTLSQDEQRLFGQGSIAGIRCTGKADWYGYRVSSFGEPFHPGRGTASAFVLVTDPAGTTTLSGGDSRVVTVRRA